MQSEGLKGLRIRLEERRERDAWFDISSRQIREGTVRYYKAKDPLTGEWLFKVCVDPEGKVSVRAVKCPPGPRFAQLEGSSMVFQPSLREGLLYDVISVSYLDEEGRVRRKVVSEEGIPTAVKEICDIELYEAATGKSGAHSRHPVTLVKKGDYHRMIALFLVERAWPIAPLGVENALKYLKHSVDVLNTVRRLEMASEEDVYMTLEEEHGMQREEAQAIIEMLKRRGDLLAPKEGYIKTALK